MVKQEFMIYDLWVTIAEFNDIHDVTRLMKTCKKLRQFLIGDLAKRAMCGIHSSEQTSIDIDVQLSSFCQVDKYNYRPLPYDEDEYVEPSFNGFGIEGRYFWLVALRERFTEFAKNHSYCGNYAWNFMSRNYGRAYGRLVRLDASFELNPVNFKHAVDCDMSQLPHHGLGWCKNKGCRLCVYGRHTYGSDSDVSSDDDEGSIEMTCISSRDEEDYDVSGRWGTYIPGVGQPQAFVPYKGPGRPSHASFRFNNPHTAGTIHEYETDEDDACCNGVPPILRRYYWHHEKELERIARGNKNLSCFTTKDLVIAYISDRIDIRRPCWNDDDEPYTYIRLSFGYMANVTCETTDHYKHTNMKCYLFSIVLSRDEISELIGITPDA